MRRGENTNNTLKELIPIWKEMQSGKFDYDGRIPSLVEDEVMWDIIELTEDVVPKMIGALMEADKVLSKMNYNPEAKNIHRLHHGIKHALQKAGVTINEKAE